MRWPRAGDCVAVLAGSLVLVALVAAGMAQLTPGGLGNWLRGGSSGDPELEQRPGAIPASPAETFSERYNKCHALLIGVAGAYAGSGHAILMNPVRGVEGVAEKLIENDPARWQGSITLLIEERAHKAAIEAELSRLEKDADPEDGVLLYFSGHAMGHRDEWFLVPAGTTGPNPDRNEGYVRENRILRFLGTCRAKHVLVVLDYCYTGTMFVPSKGQSGASAQGPNMRAMFVPSKGRPDASAQNRPMRLAGLFLKEHARQIIDAAGADSGAFCRAFLNALTPKPGGPYRDFVTADQVFSDIGTKMGRTLTGTSLQVPVILRTRPGKGSFVFFLPK